MMNLRGWIVLACVVVASAAAGWTAGGYSGGQAGAHRAGELWNAANVTSDNRTAVEIKRDIERDIERSARK